jgi:histidinol dehydrogenase
MIQFIDLRSNKDSDIFNKLAARSQLNYGDTQNRVSDIVNNVKLNGDKAVLEYTNMFDKVELCPDNLKVSQIEIEEAYEKVDKELVEVIKRARKNIAHFHEKQLEKSWFTTGDDGIILGQLYNPLEVVGIYSPGGTAAYPSSVLMNAVPAQVAGVKRIVMVTPPGGANGINPAILVAANEAGVNEIYRIGGAQAVAALAFGTQTIPKVDKIVGPGNIYVALAKRMVYGYCDIDAIAGPSEIMVLADENANPRFVAADMLSQAEHDAIASALLVTTSERIASEVQKELNIQLNQLPRKEIAEKSLKDFGAIIVVDDLESAINVANKIAPEHLELCVNEPFGLISYIKNAGAIFLGNYSSEPLGDYFAGPNHVLPTSGTARFFSPLNISEFMKKSSIISYSKKALLNVKDDVIMFAEAEGLKAHANAIRVRFE